MPTFTILRDLYRQKSALRPFRGFVASSRRADAPSSTLARTSASLGSPPASSQEVSHVPYLRMRSIALLPHLPRLRERPVHVEERDLASWRRHSRRHALRNRTYERNGFPFRKGPAALFDRGSVSLYENGGRKGIRRGHLKMGWNAQVESCTTT